MKRIIVSGYFNPLHGGHLDMFEAAAAMGDQLTVIVNNDVQQVMKKGKIILDQANRQRLVRSLRMVDTAVVAVDNDSTVIMSLKILRTLFPGDTLVFANGGDRDGERAIPESETCRELGIEMVFGVGSDEVTKRDSSTRINRETGEE